MEKDGKGWEGMGKDGKGWGREGKGWEGMGKDGEKWGRNECVRVEKGLMGNGE